MITKLKTQIIYAYHTRMVAMIFAFILFLLLVIDWMSGWSFMDTVKTGWDKDISQMVAFSTLGIAASVWWTELLQEWRSNLPKRLTVDFIFIRDEQPVVVMCCKEAHLTEVADIRALGQQIGSQLVNPDDPYLRLSFRAPYVNQTQPIIKYKQSIGFYQYYHVEFTLNNLPPLLDANYCRVWRDPFDKENIEVANIEPANDEED